MLFASWIAFFAASTSPTLTPQNSEMSSANYSGQKVLKVQIRSQADLDRVQDLASDIWTHHWRSPKNDSVTFSIAPDQFTKQNLIGLDYKIIHHDLQIDIDRQFDLVSQRRELWSPNHSLRGDITDYLNLEEIEARIDQYAIDYPDLVKIEEIGRSVENRPIRVLRANGKASTDGNTKAAILLLGGHHAREWLAHHATLCVTNRLVTGYGTDAVATKWLDSFEYMVISIGNPDGYAFTWDPAGDRLWRKNRGHNKQGVDLNRNWDVAWGTASSSDPSSESFHGTGPFSEPETAAYSAFINANPQIRGFMDIHAFGSVILYPYGYTFENASNHDQLVSISDEMSQAMGMVGEKYAPIKITDFAGEVSGSSLDWVQDNASDVVSLALEVRGESFVVDASNIQPTCDEIYTAILKLLEHLPANNSDDDDDSETGGSDTGGIETDSDTDSSDDEKEGCGCTSTSSNPRDIGAHGPWSLGLLVAFLFFRRSNRSHSSRRINGDAKT